MDLVIWLSPFLVLFGDYVDNGVSGGHLVHDPDLRKASVISDRSSQLLAIHDNLRHK